MENEIKLTKLAKCAGCGAKVGAGVLAQLLDGIKVHTDPNLLVGFDKSDDASVYKLSDELAIVQTVDFFPPIADDPYTFGQIAATNALSDVYAMGGEPKLALNLMCIPEKMPREAVHALLRGGYDKVYEAGAIITGGHSILDDEPKYGLAVTGFVHPDRVLTNSGARPGDVLIHGHTHVHCALTQGDYTYLNPGSAALPKEGQPKSYMIYENGLFSIRALETGEELLAWRLGQ